MVSAKKIGNIIVGRRAYLERFIDCFYYLILLLLPFERVMEGVGFLQYFVLLFIAVSLFQVKLYYGKLSLAVVFYMLFLIWGSISDVRTTGWLGFASIWIALRAWVVWVLMLVAYNMSLRSNKKTRIIIFCILIMAISVGVMQVAGIGADRSTDRVEVMGANVNASARMLNLVLLFFVTLLSGGIKARLYKIIIVGMCSAAALYALLRTGSRGGTLALAFGMSFLVFTTKKVSKKVVYLVLAGLVIAAFVFAVMSNELLMERFYSAYYEDDTGGRKGFIEMSWILLEQEKMWGYGCIAYTIVLGQAFGIELRATHNTFMYGLMAAGYPGACCYYLSLGLIALSAWRIRFLSYGNFLLMVLAMMLSSGYVMNIEGTKWLYVVYGVVLGYADRVRYAKKLKLPLETYDLGGF